MEKQERQIENYEEKIVNIGVIIVTYNRKNELTKTLRLFDEQSSLPEYLIVVDNASTDGTFDILEKWKQEKSKYKRIVIHTKENLGGSGGFYTGLQKATELEADWIWVSDDDAFPEQDALEQASNYLEGEKEHIDRISAICGMVINHGRIDVKHRKRYYPKGITIVEECMDQELYKRKEFDLNAFSYVGSIISKEKIEKVGLTNKDYFIWWDDTEHSLRLSKVGRIVCVPAIKIHHDVEESGYGLTWKTYYGFRNMCDMYRKHMPRRCYQYFCLKIRIKTQISKLTGWKKEEMTILNDAYQDCRNRKFGIHPVYRPGWKVSATERKSDSGE